MRIISFGWTSEPFLAGAKTVTRRAWSDSYARSFKLGERCQAYNRSPRFGGEQIGIVELTAYPHEQRTSLMPAEDFRAEGFQWMAERGMTLHRGSPWAGMNPYEAWEAWKASDDLLWVVRFRVLEIEGRPVEPAAETKGTQK